MSFTKLAIFIQKYFSLFEFAFFPLSTVFLYFPDRTVRHFFKSHCT